MAQRSPPDLVKPPNGGGKRVSAPTANTRQRDRVMSAGILISLVIATVMLFGRKGAPAQGEQQARQDLKAVSGVA